MASDGIVDPASVPENRQRVLPASKVSSIKCGEKRLHANCGGKISHSVIAE